MNEIISNMEPMELAVAWAAVIVGLAVGYLVAVIRGFLKNIKFRSEENQIKKQLHRMTLGQLRKLSEDGKLRIDPAMKTLLGKIDFELNSIDIHCGERKLERDIEELSSFLQQLANA